MALGMSLHSVTCTGTDASGLDFLASCRLGDFVEVVGGVGTDFPEPSVLLDGTIGKGDFNTLVLHVTDVTRNLVAEVGERSHIDGVDEVGRFTEIGIDATEELVVDDTEVKTHVICSGGFPGKVLVIGIGTVEDTVVHGRIERIAYRIDIVRSKIAVVADTVLLACLTITETEFEFAHPVHILEEILVLDTPCKGEGGEEAPLVALGEAAGTVVTYGGSEDVAVEEDVVSTSEDGSKVAFALPGFTLGVNLKVVGYIPMIVKDRLLAVAKAVALVVLAAPFEATHDVEVVLVVEVLVILQIGRITEIVAGFLFPLVPAIIESGVTIGVAPVFDASLVVFHRTVDMEAKVFETMDFIVHLSITDEGVALTGVLFVVEQADRVSGSVGIESVRPLGVVVGTTILKPLKIASKIVPTAGGSGVLAVVAGIDRLGGIHAGGSTDGIGIGPTGVVVHHSTIETKIEVVVKEAGR